MTAEKASQNKSHWNMVASQSIRSSVAGAGAREPQGKSSGSSSGSSSGPDCGRCDCQMSGVGSGSPRNGVPAMAFKLQPHVIISGPCRDHRIPWGILLWIDGRGI